MAKLYMAIDQYGNHFHGLTHPRKDLQRMLSGKVSKMLIDDNDGKTYHVGYIVGHHWCNVYEVQPMRKEVSF